MLRGVKRATERVTFYCRGEAVHRANVGTMRAFATALQRAQRASGCALNQLVPRLDDGTEVWALRWMPRYQGFGWTGGHRRVFRARELCHQVQLAKRQAPELLSERCRLLVEALSSFGREEPEARIRARACGCPL